MNIIRIVSKEVDARHSDGSIILWKVQMTDGKTTWGAHMNPSHLRRCEIEQQLAELGTNMELVSELTNIVWREGQDSMQGD